jgi:hypothetical protein
VSVWVGQWGLAQILFHGRLNPPCSASTPPFSASTPLAAPQPALQQTRFTRALGGSPGTVGLCLTTRRRMTRFSSCSFPRLSDGWMLAGCWLDVGWMLAGCLPCVRLPIALLMTCCSPVRLLSCSSALLFVCSPVLLQDSSDPRDTFLYKLSTQPAFELFERTIFVASPQDKYVPLSSALLQPCSKVESDRSLGRFNCIHLYPPCVRLCGSIYPSILPMRTHLC